MDRKSIRVCAERRRNRENVRGESVVQRKTHTSLAHAHAHTYIYIYIERERERAQLFPFSRERFVVVLILVKKKNFTSKKKSPPKKSSENFKKHVCRQTNVGPHRRHGPRPTAGADET